MAANTISRTQVRVEWFHMDLYDGEFSVTSGPSYGVAGREVIVAGGRVFIGSEIAATLGGNGTFGWYGRIVQIGRRKYEEVTADMIESYMRQADYERRSDRERRVAERNWKAIEWLTDHAKVLR